MMSIVATALLSLQLATAGSASPAQDEAAPLAAPVAAAVGRSHAAPPGAALAAPPGAARAAAAPTPTAPTPAAPALTAETKPAAPAPAADTKPAEVAADWARASSTPVATAAAIRAAVSETIAAERAAERAALPTYRFSSAPPPDRYQVFAEQFDDARVPDCLHADGLKRQPTFIFGGLLALPFVAIAKLRGKCN